MTKERLFHVGVKALLTNSANKLLVLRTIPFHNTEPHWDIPGGRIQQSDDAETTLRREVAEETGISNIDGITFYTAVISNIEIPVAEVGTVGLLLMIYTVRTSDTAAIDLSDEHTTYEWVDYQEAAKRLSYKYPPAFTTLLAGVATTAI